MTKLAAVRAAAAGLKVKQANAPVLAKFHYRAW